MLVNVAHELLPRIRPGFVVPIGIRAQPGIYRNHYAVDPIVPQECSHLNGRRSFSRTDVNDYFRTQAGHGFRKAMAGVKPWCTLGLDDLQLGLVERVVLMA